MITHGPLEAFLTPSTLTSPIEGRYQVIPLSDDRYIIIDFAHTGDAFVKLFSFIHAVEPTRQLVALFSAAGRRDSGKRIPLGEAAGSFCSRIYLTEEDSRDEDIHQIWEEIEQGIHRSSFCGHIERFEDRVKAVHAAVTELRPKEILLLLGKGHEKSIERNGISQPYDERTLVESIIRGRP